MMTEESLREILRDPSYPREMRRLALSMIIGQQTINRIVHYQERLLRFRADMGGAFLPELMAA